MQSQEKKNHPLLQNLQRNFISQKFQNNFIPGQEVNKKKLPNYKEEEKQTALLILQQIRFEISFSSFLLLFGFYFFFSTTKTMQVIVTIKNNVVSSTIQLRLRYAANFSKENAQKGKIVNCLTL
jgi:hypothetical protein